MNAHVCARQRVIWVANIVILPLLAALAVYEAQGSRVSSPNGYDPQATAPALTCAQSMFAQSFTLSQHAFRLGSVAFHIFIAYAGWMPLRRCRQPKNKFSSQISLPDLTPTPTTTQVCVWI